MTISAPDTSSDPFDPAQYAMCDSVGYLLGRAKSRLAHGIEQEMASLDITHAQASCLMMLARGTAATVTDLGRELNTDVGSVTRLLNRMEKRGLIVRQRRDDDRRVVDLSLTEEGRTLAGQLPPLFCNVLRHHFRNFSAEEIEILRAMLKRVIGDNSG